MTPFADAAGAALLREVENLAAENGITADTPALERIRLLSRSLQQACAYFEAREPAPRGAGRGTAARTGDQAPQPPTQAPPDLDHYQRIAATGADAVVVACLLHDAGTDLIERLTVLRTVFDLSLEEARAADDRGRTRSAGSPSH